MTKWGSFGSADGQFSCPVGIAVDDNGNIYVADGFNHRIQEFSPDKSFITQWGNEGPGNGQFYLPDEIAVDNRGSIYVTENVQHRLQKFIYAGINNGEDGGSGDEGSGEGSSGGGCFVTAVAHIFSL
jgi:tripartite motif-containing protein 71